MTLTKKTWGIGLLAILALFLGMLANKLQLGFAPPPTESPNSDSAVALYQQKMSDMDGQLLSLDAYRGHLTVINFWATWCPPCVEEIPELDRFYRQYAPDKLKMLGIAIDSPSQVKAFLVHTPINYPLLFGGLEGTQLASQLGNTSGGLPFTVVISPEGKIFWRHMGRISLPELENVVRRAQSNLSN